MGMLKKRWHRLPAKKQVILHGVVIVTLLFLCYAFLGCPPLTVRNAFRRAEKATLTGPSVILSQTAPRGYPYDALVAARDDGGVVLFAYDRGDPSRSELVYREETDPVTVLAAPGDILFQYEQKAAVPLVLFHHCEDASRAELDITLQQGTFEKTYHLDAEQEASGCFVFLLQVQNAALLGEEGAALHLLQEICSNSMAGNLDVTVPVTVRLYEQDGTLILEDSQAIRSAAAQAQSNP